MERSYNHRSQEQTQPSELLADISLNSLGLILIVLLVFVILFSRIVKGVRLPETSTAASIAIADFEAVKKENRELKNKLDAMLLDAKQVGGNAKSSGLWRFRISVDRLVDHNDRARPSDLLIEYFIYLNVQGTQVQGTLFGVKEDPDSNEQGSATHAKISGTFENGNMKIELFFTGAALGGSEILQVKFHEDRYNGKLLSGKHKYGYQNYTGSATGTRLDSSVFGD